MKKMTDAEIKITEQQWIAAIRAQAAGADTVDEWCKKQGCTRSTFYRWKGYLKEKYNIDFDSVQPEGQVSVNGVSYAPIPNARGNVNGDPNKVIIIRVGNVEFECRENVPKPVLSKLIHAAAEK